MGSRRFAFMRCGADESTSILLDSRATSTHLYNRLALDGQPARVAISKTFTPLWDAPLLPLGARRGAS